LYEVIAFISCQFFALNYLRKKLKQNLYSLPLYIGLLKRDQQNCKNKNWLDDIYIDSELSDLIFVEVIFSFVLVFARQLIDNKIK